MALPSSERPMQGGSPARGRPGSEAVVLIADIVRSKGDQVVTTTPESTVRTLIELLDQHRIGALVVSTDGRTIQGIVSERDVVRRLHRDGAAVLDQTVGDIMTAQVRTCSPEDNLEHTAQVMTEARVRHLPVVTDGQLVAIISIGDVVKHRIDELQVERDQLVDYIHR